MNKNKGKYISSILKISMFVFTLLCINNLYINYSYAENLPKIILESYSLKNGSFEMGETTTVSFKFKNTGAMHARNVVITYESEKGYLHSVFGKSNQIHIPILSAGKSYSVDVKLEVSMLEELETMQSIPLYFSAKCYSFATGTSDVNEFAIYAPINSVKLQSEIVVATTAKKGGQTFISVNLENKGYKDLYDIKMFVLGNVSASDSDESDIKLTSKEKKALDILGNKYICFKLGDVVANGTGYKDNTMSFLEAGNQNISVLFSYEDKDGNTFIQVEDEKYNVNVQNKYEVQNETQVDISSEIEKKQLVLVVIVVFLTTVIISIILVKRKKR